MPYYDAFTEKVFHMEFYYCNYNKSTDTILHDVVKDRTLITRQPHLWGAGKFVEMFMKFPTDKVAILTMANGFPVAYKDVILVETGTDFEIYGREV